MKVLLRKDVNGLGRRGCLNLSGESLEETLHLHCREQVTGFRAARGHQLEDAPQCRLHPVKQSHKVLEFTQILPVAQRLPNSNAKNVFPRVLQTAPIELTFGGV